ncbi:surface lipoprotein assembly modifier [Novosphingobium aerophilum]|uniref:DUF560 domain-containing protein n=1 Tax=Novosphingobium aerophilum TaxID=2839843 RepID=A0A7X1KCK0_9SPHN|nr:surface lipoprotein assembly modifier [Novosphingobium aerophilum]MBC2652353.1 DUF560 domain-containing protein [Novosphingobium aerophilum]
MLPLSAAAALLTAAAPGTGEPPAPVLAPIRSAVVESRFLEAVQLIDTGRPDLGAEILKQIYAATPTPRVRLELARALMLSGQFKTSRDLFVEAFKDDPPPVVRANILAFLNRIDRLKGKLTLGTGFARYSNPLQQPGAYTLNFGGIALTYEADERYRNQWGTTLSGSYVKELRGGWLVSASASWRNLPLDRADQVGLEGSVTRQIGNTPLEVKVGAARLSQTDLSFTLPYVQGAYSVPLGPKLGLRPAMTAAYYRADAGPAASGIQMEAYVPLIYSPSPARALSIGPSLLHREASYREQAFTAVAIRALASRQSDLINLEGGLQASLTVFGAADPFFGERRKERRIFGSVSASSYKVRLGPFIPAVALSCDLVHSNIGYFQRKGCDTSVELRKVF